MDRIAETAAILGLRTGFSGFILRSKAQQAERSGTGVHPSLLDTRKPPNKTPLRSIRRRPTRDSTSDSTWISVFFLPFLHRAGASDTPSDSLFGSGSLALSALPADSHRLGLHCRSSKEFFHSLLSYIHRRLSAMNLTNEILTRTEEDDQSWMFPHFHVLRVGC